MALLSLTPQETLNPIVPKLRAHFEERLHHLRVENDQPMDADKRTHLLAEIRVVKELVLALSDDRSAAP